LRLLVLGSGVVSVTSAYYLARAGHEVTVFDRQPGPGLETSFASAGQVSSGWTVACGSARVLAALISCQVPEIESCNLATSRYAA